MTGTETQLLAELKAEVKILVKTVTSLSDKMDELQKEHVTEISTRMAVAEEKVGRLEKIIYSVIGVVVCQLIAIVFQILTK